MMIAAECDVLVPASYTSRVRARALFPLADVRWEDRRDGLLTWGFVLKQRGLGHESRWQTNRLALDTDHTTKGKTKPEI
jgi:hypothetical protein